MSSNIFSLESAKNHFQLELIKQFAKAGYHNPQNFVEIMDPLKGVGVSESIDQDTKKIVYRTDLKIIRTIFYVFRKKVLNALGADDWVTYYLIYAKRWYKSWANPGNMDVKRYDGHDGLLFQPQPVFDHIWSTTGNGRSTQRSAIAIIIAEPPGIYYVKVSDLCKEFTRKEDQYRYFIDDYGVKRSGIPKEICKREDVFS